MKVQRYTYGKTNVAELQAQRNAAITPKEGAEAAAVPYKAITQASEAITKALVVEDERRGRIQAQEDDVTQKIILMKNKGRQTAMKNDPKYQDQMQSDGTPTASTMLNDYEEHATQLQNELAEIQDPKTREQFGRILDIELQDGRLRMRSEVNDRMEAWNAISQIDLFGIAVEGQDWVFAKQQLDYMRNNDIISVAKHIELSKAVEVQKIDVQTDAVADEYRAAEMIGKGDEAYKRLVENPDPDPDVQKARIAKVEGIRNNFKIARQKEEAVTKGQMIRDFETAKRQIANGELVDINNLYTVWAAEDPVWAAQAEGDLLQARYKGVSVAANVQEAGLRLQNGIPLMNTKTERTGLDGWIAQATPVGATPQEAFDISIGLQKQAQIPSESSYRLMAAGGRDPASTQSGAEMYMALVDPNNLTQMDLGLTEDKEMLYSQIALMTANDSMSVAEASSIMQERNVMKSKDPDKYDALTNVWKADGVGVESAIEAFNDMQDTYYDKSWIPGVSNVSGADEIDEEITTSDANTQANYFRYQRYYKNAWLLTEGNADGAKELADVMYQRSTPLTNINGEWQAQYQGIAGDAQTLASDWKTQFADNKYLARNANGQYQVFNLSDLSDDVTFEDPEKNNGQTQYKLYHKGEQLAPWSEGANILEASRLGATATFDKTDEMRMNKDNDPLKKKIDEMEEQLLKVEKADIQDRSDTLLESPGMRPIKGKKKPTRSEIERTRQSLDSQYPGI